MKNTWKGIKTIISLQKTTNDSPIISLRDHTITVQPTIKNTLNSFFCLVGAKIQSEVPFSYKTFFEYLPRPNQDFFLILPCTKEEIR